MRTSLSPDGASLYGRAFGGSQVVKIDGSSGALLDLWPIREALIKGISVTQDRVQAGLTIIDADSGAIEREMELTGARPDFGLLAPTGQMVAYVGPDGLSLWSLDGRQLLAEAAPADGPTIAALASSAPRARDPLAVSTGPRETGVLDGRSTPCRR